MGCRCSTYAKYLTTGTAGLILAPPGETPWGYDRQPLAAQRCCRFSIYWEADRRRHIETIAAFARAVFRCPWGRQRAVDCDLREDRDLRRVSASAAGGHSARVRSYPPGGCIHRPEGSVQFPLGRIGRTCSG